MLCRSQQPCDLGISIPLIVGKTIGKNLNKVCLALKHMFFLLWHMCIFLFSICETVL